MAGRFLISEPFMADPNFQRTVVLLVEHNEAGSLGFVLNRQLVANIQDLVDDVPPFEAPIFLGGPVEHNTLHFLHTRAELPGAQPLGDGIFWSGNADALFEQIRQESISPQEVVFCLGYAGWGAGQLQNELDQKTWIVTPAEASFIFTENYGDLWQRLLHHMGGKYRILANYPADPQLN